MLPTGIPAHALERLGLQDFMRNHQAEFGLDPGVEDLSAALGLLRRANQGVKELAVWTTLDVALAYGTLGLVQNRLSRLVAESLGLGPSFLQQAFLERTGQDLPDPWDPSDPEHWRRREEGPLSPWNDVWIEEPPAPQPKFHSPKPPKAAPDDPRIARIKALALLGLDEDASTKDVKRAFHRISKVHHPDSFAGLGDEAMADAAGSFRRIRDAFEFLMRGRTP